MKNVKSILFGIAGGVIGASLMGVALMQTVVTIHPGTLRVGANALPASGVDFDFHRTTSGGSVRLDVNNDSNTASSESVMRVAVGGDNAADPQTRWTVQGTKTMVAGIDNSTTDDDWALANGSALGTNNMLVARSSGGADQIFVPDGTATNPGLATFTLPNYGLYSETSPADSLSIATNGALAMRARSDRLEMDLPVYITDYIQFIEQTVTPGTPTQDVASQLYMKGDKLIAAFNNGGTMRYFYLDLTATSNQSWIYSATAP